MEMYQIRYVIAAADYLNFTRAAAACGVSQPALTKGIKALETELDAPLFHRDGRKIVLGRLGRSLLPHLRRIAAESAAAQALAKDYALLNEVPVRLGMQSTIGPARFTRFLDVLHAEPATLELEVSVGQAEALTDSLHADDLDLAVLTRLPALEDKLTLLPLFTERYAVLLPPGHPLATQPSIALAEVGGLPYVDRLRCEMREAVMATCKERSVDLYPCFRAERDDWVIGMVRAGMGFAFLPEGTAEQTGLASRPLVDPVVEREVCIASVPGRPFPPAAAGLVRQARAYPWSS